MYGEYQASVKHPSDAAVLMAAWHGGTIRYGHGIIVWTEGNEEWEAWESYDMVAELCFARLRAASDLYRQNRGIKPKEVNATIALIRNAQGEN